jgi:hypothetical protein
VQRTRHASSGDWRTLESFFNATGTAFFAGPPNGQIKVRIGLGFFGWDLQKQTLDGHTLKRLTVSRIVSLSRARMQIKVTRSVDVTYLVYPGNIIQFPADPDILGIPLEF